MRSTLLAFALLSLVCLAVGLPTSRYLNKHSLKPEAKRSSRNLLGEPQVPYTEHYFNVNIDHFNFAATGPSSGTYPMRYLINSDKWDKKNNGPILFYCGNEGDITDFWANTGFQTVTLAEEFNGLLVFAEHRYFGKSQPFGNNSYNQENLVYLTAIQALTDYAVFLRALKSEIVDCPDCPVIAFGGSYGGMLAAWMRMKFPNVVDGSIAASAPLLYFDGVSPYEGFFDIATKDFRETSNPQCADVIAEGMRRLNSVNGDDEFNIVNKAFNPCQPLLTGEDVGTLQDWLTNAFTYMAMVDYPYETDFLTHMPGNPVDFSCQAFTNLTVNSSSEEIYTAILKAANIYYDYDNITNCSLINNSDAAGNIDGNGWNVLACADMILPMGSLGPSEVDMFPTRPWSYANNTIQCNQTYGLQSRYTWALDFFGGWDYLVDFQAYSNIFFSNGKRDPWSVGGVLQNVSDTVKAFYMEGSAHHLDLRLPNPADPSDVILGREMEKAEIRKWIAQKHAAVAKEDKIRNSLLAEF